jgi:hypothetical protein
MRPRFLLALVVPAVLACESNFLLEPDSEFVGTYVLDVSDGSVVLRWDSVRATILADTLRFREEGRASRRVITHYDYATFRDTTVDTYIPYLHQKKGFRVELEYVCPPNALCGPPPHLWGNVAGRALVLRTAEDPRPALRYRRINIRYPEK